MILIKFDEKLNSNRWFCNGGCLVIDAILNGSFNGLDSDGTVLQTIPSEIMTGIGIDLTFSQNMFKGIKNVPDWKTTPYFPGVFNIDIADKKPQEEIKSSFKQLGINSKTYWGVFTEYDAFEIKRLCNRIKDSKFCPIEFIQINDCYFDIVVYRDYENINPEELNKVCSNCFYTNNKGCFVMTNLGYKIAANCDYNYPYTDLDWIKRKIS